MYGGVDQLTGKEIRLRQTVSALATRRETEREAAKVQTRLLNQVDERRSPKTEATVNQLLDRWLEVIDIERKTRTGYVGKIEKHVRPTIGRLQVGRVKAETIDSLYAQLRRCRDHCRGEKSVQHRTHGEHVCDEHTARRKCAEVTNGDPSARCRWCERACASHRCVPLAAGSIRVVHAILSGAFMRAVRWGWIAVSPIEQTEPPAVPRPNPAPPTAEEAAAILTESWKEPDWGVLVWFAMTTGARRGEVCGLRWSQLDLDRGVARFQASIGQIAGDVWEKDTKTHQHRRVTLDAELVDDTEPEQRVTAAEWLAADREAVIDADRRRDITETDVHDLTTDVDHSDEHPVDEPRVGDADDARTASGPAEASEQDIREVAADEPAPVDEDVVRVPTADETADALSGASRALAEIGAREVADQREEAEHRAAELIRWHTTDQATAEATDADEHIDEMGDHDPAPAGAP